MNEILAAHTGRSVADIARDTERDYYMSASEAKEYGVVDQVVAKRKAPEPTESRGGKRNGSA